jgi:hypothetical protein
MYLQQKWKSELGTLKSREHPQEVRSQQGKSESRHPQTSGNPQTKPWETPRPSRASIVFMKGLG